MAFIVISAQNIIHSFQIMCKEITNSMKNLIHEGI